MPRQTNSGKRFPLTPDTYSQDIFQKCPRTPQERQTDYFLTRWNIYMIIVNKNEAIKQLDGTLDAIAASVGL